MFVRLAIVMGASLGIAKCRQEIEWYGVLLREETRMRRGAVSERSA